VQSVGTGDSASIVIRSEALDPAQLVALKQALFDTFQPVSASGAPSQDVISDSAVSGSWGGQITRQALIALARSRGLALYPIAPFYLEPPDRAGLLMGYGGLSVAEIGQAMAVFAQCLDEMFPVSSARRDRRQHHRGHQARGSLPYHAHDPLPVSDVAVLVGRAADDLLSPGDDEHEPAVTATLLFFGLLLVVLVFRDRRVAEVALLHELDAEQLEPPARGRPTARVRRTGLPSAPKTRRTVPASAGPAADSGP
jgi:hypothetical protein